MTTYAYPGDYPDDEIDFNPTDDVLVVHEGSAADFTLTPRQDGSGTQIARPGEGGLGLMGVALGTLNATNVVFDDGSLLLNASVANAFSSVLAGSVHDDLLIGSAGTVRQEVATSLGTPRGGTYAAGASSSADGRYVAFLSNDPQLDGNPPNQDARNMYLKDLLTGQVTQVSSSSAGAPGNQATWSGSISGDGRFVAFESYASNFVGGDTNGDRDIYLKNVVTGEVKLVSTRTGGDAGTHADAWGASVSYDGRYVAFSSAASNLVANDTNQSGDIFVKDLVTGELKLVSADSNGVQGNYGASGDGSGGAKISADGKHVIFASWSDNLAGDDDWHMDVFVKNLETGELVNVTGNSGIDWYGAAKVGDISADGRYVLFQTGEHMLDDDWNGSQSIYRKDLQTGELERVCVGYPVGEQSMAISGDGRYVVFSTQQSLVDADSFHSDVYVKDMQTGAVVLVSQSVAGNPGNSDSVEAEISLDGSTIVFTTYASNLVAGDTNGTASTVVVSNPLHARTLNGGAGDDTYVISNGSDVVVEEAAGGTDTIRSSVTKQLSSNVENLELTGQGAINGTGNALDNVITGNDAANVLDGGAGADTLSGGAGNDTYVVDRVADVMVETAGMGIDTVRSSFSLVLQPEFEKLVLTGTSNLNGTGNSLANSLTGNSGANALDGGAGNDTLNGAAGIDTLTGGSGDDTYVVADAADTVVEAAGGGTDTVQAAFSLVLSAQLENLTLTGSSAINATGNALANGLVGNLGANVLDAGAGNDTLNGGAGADTMIGGAGDDIYFVDSASDQIFELAGAGTDTVNSSVTLTLQSDFERLTLIGDAYSIDGTGNALANVIVGNEGENRLDGGAGADTLSGGAGNDVYILDNAGDVVVESDAWNGGYDSIWSSVSVVMQAEVEDLVLRGSAAIDGTGNALRNSIAGNSASNVLRGGAGEDTLYGGYGGEAVDTLMGGTGNDEYQVNNTGDRVIELAGEGIDTVYSSANFVLQAELENIELLYTEAIDATGNAMANILRGNSGSNVLDGAAGADTMFGAEGNDTYVVDNVGDVTDEAGGNGIDTVQSSISHTLRTGIEKLILTGTAQTNGTGNSLANTLTGNAATNVLNGATGADTMIGGAGSDTYLADNVGDRAVEVAGGGVDLVQSSATFTLHSEVENLTLTGTTAIDGTGNVMANVIKGNSATNALDGAGGNDSLDGGAGADTLTGGTGNDTYFVDNEGDRAVEVAAGGIDLVRSSVSFQLQAEVEKLTLTGTAAINGTGNALGNTITGNAAANVLGGGSGADTLIGGAGNDTYVVDDAGDQIVEEVGNGTDLVRSSISFQLKAEVEHLTLTGTDVINGTGNALANTITGNSAANVLGGGAGADMLIGGNGNDSYVVDNAGDKTIEVAGGGIDVVRSSAATFTLQAEIEGLTLTGTSAINGTGNALANTITGNAAANAINGAAGSDTLDGAAGADSLTGGAGDDTFVVDNVADKTIEMAGGGIDLVRSSVSLTLQDEVENLALTGAAAINGTGNSLANAIIGTSAANLLDGRGGADTMTGGAGNDTYIVDNGGDEIVEDFISGTDLVQSSASYSLSAEVENLTLTGSSAINGTGNYQDNTLTGNAAANVLDGRSGADAMTGAAGNDVYVVDNTGDRTLEVSGGGIDLVESTIDFALQDEVENLTLTQTTADKGTGNALANVITGNDGYNIIDGGAGADTMAGGWGHDTYFVDNVGDTVVETVGNGVDLVYSSVSFILQAEVENLELLGSSAINGAGNSIANVLTGNSAANVLTGGAGADTLTGGAGGDTFTLNSTLGSDLITDFTHATDKQRITQSLLRVGDGDTVIDGGVSVTGPNGFASSAELVIVTHDIAGSLTSSSAAAAIGHANNAYAVGDTRLFVVDNGSDSGVYLFKAADANDTISASELTLLATLDNAASTTLTDYLFGA
jgi:Ca2+-binding RTX toxin-like protein